MIMRVWCITCTRAKTQIKRQKSKGISKDGLGVKQKFGKKSTRHRASAASGKKTPGSLKKSSFVHCVLRVHNKSARVAVQTDESNPRGIHSFISAGMVANTVPCWYAPGVGFASSGAEELAGLYQKTGSGSPYLFRA